MFPLQGILRSATQRASSVPVRTIISTPPRVRVALPEKIAHGLAIAFGVTFTPIWIIVHLDSYKKK